MKKTTPGNIPIKDDEIMISFNITSFYTNIPIVDTLDIFKNYVNNNDQYTRKTTISQNMFFWSSYSGLLSTWYLFNCKFYQQIDDVAVPASSTAAEIYRQAHEQTAISTALHHPKVW